MTREDYIKQWRLLNRRRRKLQLELKFVVEEMKEIEAKLKEERK